MLIPPNLLQPKPPTPIIKQVLANRWLKWFGWLLLLLFALSEGLNLLLPLLPINDLVCRQIEQEAYRQTGLRVAIKKIHYQWHLWEGISTQLTSVQVLPNHVVQASLPWQFNTKELTVGIDALALIFNRGNYALQRLDFQQPTLQFKGVDGVNTFIKTVDILTKKPTPVGSPRWVNKLALSAFQAQVILTPASNKFQRTVTMAPNLVLAVPRVNAIFQQATKTDPIALQFTRLQTQWFRQVVNTRQALGSLQATARFLFELPNPNEPNSTNWQQFWHFTQALKKADLETTIPSVKRIVTTLHQLQLVSANPLASHQVDASSTTMQLHVQQHPHKRWQVLTTGTTALQVPTYFTAMKVDNNPKPLLNWKATARLDKLSAKHAKLTVETATVQHSYSRSAFSTNGFVVLKQALFNSPNNPNMLRQLPVQLKAWGTVPNLTLLPPLFKQLSLPPTTHTKPLQVQLKQGAFTLNNVLLQGTVGRPTIESLAASIHRVVVQVSTPKVVAPLLMANGNILWQPSGKVLGAVQVGVNPKHLTEVATLGLARTTSPAKPVQVTIDVPTLSGSTVAAWQPFLLNALSPLLTTVPALQWQNLTWAGTTALHAQGLLHLEKQAFTLQQANGQFNQWQVRLQRQPWVGVNGRWQWQPLQGLRPQLMVALPNNNGTTRQPWLTVGGVWHLQQSTKSGITVTSLPYTTDVLVQKVFQPFNQWLLSKTQQISTTQLTQALNQPFVQPIRSALISFRSTVTAQAVQLHQLLVDKLLNTGHLTVQATVPWQAMAGHVATTAVSTQWHQIPLQHFVLQAQSQVKLPKTVSRVASMRLQQLTGATSGALTWQGQLPTQLPTVYTPKQLAWLSSLEGDIQVSALQGRVTQHPVPFTVTPLKFKVAGLEVQPIKPVQFNWGPVEVAGLVALQTDKARQQWLPNVALTLAPIPLATLQHERLFYEPFFKQVALAYPTLWRTEGSVAGQLEWQPIRKPPNAQLFLSNAGFYIPRTFAPIHGVTATFEVDLLQRALKLPQPLFVQLGNSTVLVPWLTLKNTNNRWDLALQAQGRLHPRELNSLLGNNWYFQPTQYPWLADSWLGLKASWGANAGVLSHQTASQLEANISTVLQSEGDAKNPVVTSPLAQEPTATALLSTTAVEEKLADKPLGTIPTTASGLSVLQPSKLASVGLKQFSANKVMPRIPRLITLVESPKTLLPNQPDEVVWYQQFGKTEPLQELARYPLSNTTQPLGTLALRFKGSLLQPQLQLGELRLLGRSEPLRFSASLDAPTQPHHLWSNQGRIWTEKPVDLGALATHTQTPTFRFESGAVQTNLHWQQADANPIGQLQLQAVQSQGLGLDNLEANAQFNPAQLVLTIPQFKAGGSDVSLNGVAPLPQPFPVSFDTLNVTGKTFYVEGFLDLLTQLTNKVVAPYKAGLPPTVRWVPERTISLPIQVEAGNITLNEAIVNNILANDFACQWKLFPNGFLALDGMTMAVASGTVTGQLSLSPSQRNTLSMKIMAEHVKANALAKALLNAPNQVFGNLTGSIEFSTYGYSPVAMIQHANGKASFVIAQGRVPSLDKVERLLSTANVVRGGLLGLNASNLAFSIKGASRANSVRAISGDFQIVDGQLLTRNFLSDSKNLDLAMSGGVRLDNGIADLTIIGIMPQTVVSNSKFAKLGSLSLGQLFEYVPVLGYLPVGSNKKGLFDFIPGLGYVPGLGGIPGKTNSFQAQLKGPPDDPTSIKQLRWLRQSVVPKSAVSKESK